MRLLVIEDDRMFARLLQRSLQEEGYAVDVACDAAAGRAHAFVSDYDGIVLDLLLPDGNGLQILRELRQEGRTVPVLVLTGRDSQEDVVRGLDAGADDYLRKPIDFDEFRARVRALLRRGGAQRTERLAFGGVTLDRLSRRAVGRDRELQLTPKEFNVLEHFLLNPERTVTRTELLDKVWDMHFDPGSNVVDVHIMRLRGKLQRSGTDVTVATVRGVGFRLTTQQDRPAVG